MTDLQHPTPAPGVDTTSNWAPPAMTAPTYPVEPAAPEPRKGRRWLMPVLVGFGALVVGAGIGVAASQPSINNVKDEKAVLVVERDEAAAQADQLQATLDSSQEARDTCRQATADAKDLLDQQSNFADDYAAYWATEVGSAAEATWMEHMNEQQAQMERQLVLVQSEIADCQSAIG